MLLKKRGKINKTWGNIKPDPINKCESTLTVSTTNKNNTMYTTLLNSNKRISIRMRTFMSTNYMYNLENELIINTETYHVPTTPYNDDNKQ